MFDNLSIPVFYIKGSIIQFCRSTLDGENDGLYIGKTKNKQKKNKKKKHRWIVQDCSFYPFIYIFRLFWH